MTGREIDAAQTLLRTAKEQVTSRTELAEGPVAERYHALSVKALAAARALCDACGTDGYANDRSYWERCELYFRPLDHGRR